VVDTGGLGVGVREKRVDLFDGLIREQVARIVHDADAIVWVVDCQDGLTPQDEEVADLLREAGKPVAVAANKADNPSLRDVATAHFAATGFDAILPTSCTQNTGIGDLLTEVLQHLPPAAGLPERADSRLKVAVVGRPNVGKSSLVNRLFGSERVIVSDIAGTTRDAIDVPVDIDDGDETVPMTLIDTAGLRRRRQVDSVVEFFSVARAEKAIRRSDVVLFVTDAMEPGTAQDRRIARMVVDAGKPCIMLVNKWDLVSGRMKQKELAALIRNQLSFMQHAPMHFICATSGYNVDGILEHLLQVREQMQVKVPTSVLNQFLQDTLARTPPHSVGTRRLKVFYGTMVSTPPPKFVLFVNSRNACPANYLQFLENQLREAFFPQAGLPIRIELRERHSSEQTGARKAAAGVHKRKVANKRANQRHNARRKGWRKK
jgi:GTP-binding protein